VATEQPAPAQQKDSAASQTPAGAATAEAMVGRQDHEFLTKAAQSGMAEVQVAKLAQEKATSEDVKQFAKDLEQAHSKANEELQKLAEQKGVSLPTDIGKHEKMVTKLNGLSGEKFDKEFAKMQVSHHKKDISEFKKHSGRSMDSDVKAFADAQLPVLQQHLQQAEQVAGSGTRARQAEPGTTSPSSSNPTGVSEPPTPLPQPQVEDRTKTPAQP
jgi:putative membrane protein